MCVRYTHDIHAHEYVHAGFARANTHTHAHRAAHVQAHKAVESTLEHAYEENQHCCKSFFQKRKTHPFMFFVRVVNVVVGCVLCAGRIARSSVRSYGETRVPTRRSDL
jgi:hypothetical protein